MVSQAPSLSLPSCQFLGFTLHLFGALRLARDCRERRCLEDPVVSAGGGAGAGGLKATGGFENNLRFTKWSINLEEPSEPQVSPEVSSLVPAGGSHMSAVSAELIQTELHHVRTLKIMTRLFRTGLLEELQLEPGVVQGLFPCVDELSDIHTRFLGQLLERRRQALSPGSTRNFVISRLGDLLISQVRATEAL